MAKRLVKWSLDGSILKLAKSLEDPKAVAVIEAEFDLTKLFPSFAEFTETQAQVVVYGIKQKLMDSGASDIGDGQTKIQRAKTKWQELLDGKWSGERVNATGASEERKLGKKMKEVVKEVSLLGLMTKKMAFPETFTEEDEAKLQELMAVAVEANKRGKQE